MEYPPRGMPPASHGTVRHGRPADSGWCDADLQIPRRRQQRWSCERPGSHSLSALSAREQSRSQPVADPRTYPRSQRVTQAGQGALRRTSWNVTGPGIDRRQGRQQKGCDNLGIILAPSVHRPQHPVAAHGTRHALPGRHGQCRRPQTALVATVMPKPRPKRRSWRSRFGLADTRSCREMSKFNASEYLCGGWHSHSSLRQCSRVGMAIAAPPWSCTRNEACRLWAGLSMVDSRRVPVKDNSIVGALAAR